MFQLRKFTVFIVGLLTSLGVFAQTANIFDFEDLWDVGSTTYDAIKVTVTDTASAADSKLLNLCIDVTDECIQVSKDGDLTLTGGIDLTEYIQLDTTFTDGTQEGRMQWNIADGTCEIGMPGGTVNYQCGQELLVRVRNNTGSLIANCAAVYASGSHASDKLEISLSQADSATTAFMFGLTTEAISDVDNGYVATFGKVRECNTLGFVEGDPIFLSETVAGGFQQDRPLTGSGYVVAIGVVEKAHATEGVIEIKPVIVPRLDRLSGVEFADPADKEALWFVTANDQYELFAPLAADGSIPMTGYLNMGGFGIFGVSDIGIPSQAGTPLPSAGEYVIWTDNTSPITLKMSRTGDTRTIGAYAFTTDSTTEIYPITPIVLSASSGRWIGLDLSMEADLSGTAGYDVDYADVTETSIGSGANYLHRRAVGGVDKYYFDNNGLLRLDPIEAFGFTTGMRFGADNDVGFYSPGAKRLTFVADGADKWESNATWLLVASLTSGPGLLNETASATNPTVIVRRNDSDTGAGSAGDDCNSQIAGGVEAIRMCEVSSHILIDNELHAGITASTTQTQAGGFQLLSSYNQVAIVANTGDSLVAPVVRVGRELEVINAGANPLWLWPAVGDDLGAGVDVKVVLEANETFTFRGVDDTNWGPESATQRFHAAMGDEANTDPFVISEQGNLTCYHTDGMVAIDGIGWTFDGGGAGTSFPIASIADGVASGVDIEVTTTGSHTLEVGAIISQSNLTSAVYTGVFQVKAIISVTQYEVAAVFTATDTGTMDECATLTASMGSSGDYKFDWGASVTSSTNNETFDYAFYQNATAIPFSSGRRKYGTGGDFGIVSYPVPPFHVEDDDKISFVITNNDSASNTTIRNFTEIMEKL